MPLDIKKTLIKELYKSPRFRYLEIKEIVR